MASLGDGLPRGMHKLYHYGMTVRLVSGRAPTRGFRAATGAMTTGFRVMRDRRLREVLAFDQDFGAASFVEVRA
jgi:hypothetical protein